MTTSRFMLGGFLVILGIALLLGAMVFKLLFAFLLLFLGARVIFSYPRERQASQGSSDGRLNEVAILSPFHKTVTSPNFAGGKVVLVFAGGDLDLRGATIEGQEARLEIVAIFSGLKVIVPKHWRVRIEGTAIAGGYDNKAPGGEDMQPPKLILTGAVILGSVEIVQ